MPALLLVLLFAAAAAEAGPRVEAVAVSEPRAFGYFLGDTIRREVILTLRAGARIEPASLPRPGPLNYWLELREIKVSEQEAAARTEARITLEYQTFYAALDPRRLEVPGFTLKVADESGSENATIPPWSFIVSPLREIMPGKEGEPAGIELRPDAPPQRLPTSLERTGMLLAAVTGTAALILLAMHYAWWPFRRRPTRPFTEAARFLRTSSGHLSGEGGYRAALIKLHRAFDTAAGRRVLPDDVASFLAEHPEFAPLSADIERLFACSRTAFYGNDVPRARAVMPIERIAELGARLGAAERRAA
jgi:mxaA protein